MRVAPVPRTMGKRPSNESKWPVCFPCLLDRRLVQIAAIQHIPGNAKFSTKKKKKNGKGQFEKPEVNDAYIQAMTSQLPLGSWFGWWCRYGSRLPLASNHPHCALLECSICPFLPKAVVGKNIYIFCWLIFW